MASQELVHADALQRALQGIRQEQHNQHLMLQTVLRRQDIMKEQLSIFMNKTGQAFEGVKGICKGRGKGTR